MYVLLNPKTKNSFEIGSGYTSGTGHRAKIIWKKPWINSCGHNLETSFSLSDLEQFINLNYKIPVLYNPLEEYYLLQGGWIYENMYDLPSQIVTINIARYWNCINSWRRAVNLHWYVNQCIQQKNKLNKKNVMLICPGININRVQQKGKVMPYWVNSQRYSINISSSYWKSDINFIILQAQNVWIRTFFKKHRFLIRNNVSWIEINDKSFIIPSFRFFFTKVSDIRGYEYKSLLTYDYIEYTKLITSTVEYQYYLFDKGWGVVFIDFGEIGNHIKWKNFKSGFGIGIRWQLPVGPLKLDIAVPLTHKIKINRNFFHFHISIGPEL